MASKPTFRGFLDLLQQMTSVFSSESGVDDYSTSSVTRSLFEAAALSDFKTQGDIIASLNTLDIDRAEGIDLDRFGEGRGVKRPQARAATGLVSFSSKNMSKISTKIYAGTAAPPAGSSSVFVSDATQFPSTGQVYIGRGSNNVEGPINFSSIAQVGNYYQINLSTPTTKNHTNNESVILAQSGNRVIQAGTVVQTVSNITVPAIQYRTLITATIPDGEKEVTDVPVVCTTVGSKGNSPANSVVSVSGLPFVDAAVNNPLSFVSGKDKMSDPDYRLLIKNFEQSKSKATNLAIKLAAVDTTSSDDNKIVTAAEISTPSNREEPAVLYIDDSTVYQPIFSGQGFEQVIDQALGGEKFIQLRNEDITKALVVSTLTAPFSITGGMVLSVLVGNVVSEHTFNSSDFATPNSVESFEIVNSINANTSLLFSAKTSNNNKEIVIFAKDYKNEDMRVTSPSNNLSTNANDYLGFSEDLTYTLRLYKNDILLIKDGSIPTAYTQPQSSWLSLLSTAYLIVQVDNSTPIIYNFSANDFIPYGYNTMSSINSLSAWVNVLNAKINGITASINSSSIKIVSNKGASNSASLKIYMDAPANAIGSTSGTNLANALFGLSGTESLISSGLASDYTLNRSTGQVQLVTPLVAGDAITAGSKNTRAFISSATTSSGSVVVGTSGAGPLAWMVIDNPAAAIAASSDLGTVLTFSVSSDLVTVTSSVSNDYVNLLPNDWVIMADDAINTLDPDYIGAYRIQSATSNSFTFRMNTSLGTNGAATLSGSKKVQFVRTSGIPEKISFLSGTQTITNLAENLNSQLPTLSAKSIGGRKISLYSKTFASNGSLFYIVNTTAADPVGFLTSENDVSTISHTAFAESANSDSSMPSFVHEKFWISDLAKPPVSLTTISDIFSLGDYINKKLQFINPFQNTSSNSGQSTYVSDRSGLNLTVRPNYNLKDVIADDRFCLIEGYNFDTQDNLVAIVDGDAVNNSFNINLSRKATVKNTPTPTQDTFKAYDSDGGPTASFATFFGDNFDFNDFKIHLKARSILYTNGVNSKMLIRAAVFGPAGEKIRFSVAYPQLPNTPMNSTVSVKDYTNIKVFLASGAERLGGAWNTTTQFDVTNPTAGTFRYTWNSAGTNPQFVTLANVQVGDVVNIQDVAGFSADNKGAFKVTAVTDSYFEVYSSFGINENNKTLTNSLDLRFYQLNSSQNKASDLQTYVLGNLSQYVSISQYGSGAGIISTSTFDDNLSYEVMSEYASLVDSINYIKTSTIGTKITPVDQFQLKNQLKLSELDTDYTLVGEEFYLIPTNAEQLSRFLNVFSVTSLSNSANISLSSDGHKLQIYSNQFGSNGSIQITGGTANGVTSAITSNGTSITALSVKSLARSGSSVLATCSSIHPLIAGQVIIVKNANNPSFNGTFTITSTTPKTFMYSQTVADYIVTSSGLSRSSNIVTATLTTAHTLAIGDTFTLVGATDGSFDGTFVVISAPTSLTITYAQAGVNASSGNGLISSIATKNGDIGVLNSSLSVNKLSSSGLQVGQIVKMSNSSVQDKSLGFALDTQVQLVSADQVTISGSGSFQTAQSHSGDATTQVKVEKQGDFTCVSWTGTGAAPVFSTNVKEGSWIRIQGNFNSLNQGIYKVEKMFLDNSLYLINASSVEETITLSANSDMLFYSYDSVMPNDTLYIGTDLLGSSYKGSYVVKSSPFPTSSTIHVDGVFTTGSATALGASYNLVTVKEAVPFHSYNKIANISSDPLNSNSSIVVLEGMDSANKNTISAGGSINSTAKLNFSTITKIGADSYKYYGGLVSAVGKKIRGQAEDPITYAGVAGAGSYIVIDTPLAKRIQIGIVVRNQTGINFSIIKTRVQTAVSSYVNSLQVGQSVVFSEIIARLQNLNGVQAISVSSPTYDATHDHITVNYNEKAQIKNLITDITVTLAT